ncbi:L-dopachrome tautomerase-related protein [Pseudomonas sp. QTF5]|uniref:L-dopachrome tautomerase-related protein n=1 Tax=Pseudomonas sp. QTF5 TaxID=1435425 RepID=UPI0004BE4179|nr:L-dopachrome tautomerase-related protein [Pseudomonas sp. QTF5]
MKCIALAGVLVLVAVTQSPAFAAVQTPHEPELWRSYTGVSWDLGAEHKVDAASHQAPIAGLHFSHDGRAFVSTPRWITSAVPASLNTLSLDNTTGPAVLTAFPSAQWNTTDGRPSQTLRNVLGFHVDNTHNWLWALDMGFVPGEKAAPIGGQKIVIFDLKTGQVVRNLPLDNVADRQGSFLNDIAVDEARRIAYISDSGFRSAPDNSTGVIVYNFSENNARRVLHKDASVQVRKDVPVISHGKTVWEGQPLSIGINGIALSKDSNTLYWTVTTGDSLFAIDTAKLTDPNLPAAELAAAVKTVAHPGISTDGIMVTDDGKVLITDVTHNGIVSVDPATGVAHLIEASDRVYWPDTVTAGVQDGIYFTSSNTNDHFANAVARGAESYNIWRFVLPLK